MTESTSSSPSTFSDIMLSPPASKLAYVPHNLTHFGQTSDLEVSGTKINVKDLAISAPATVEFNSQSTISTEELYTERDSSKALAVSCTEFYYFLKLPPELRCKIWQFVLPGPRYIEIITEFMLDPKDNLWYFSCANKAPGLFFVSRESRAEVKKIYQPLQGTDSKKAAIWCDFERDFICFTAYRSAMEVGKFLDNFPAPLAKKITNVGSDRLAWDLLWDEVSEKRGMGDESTTEEDRRVAIAARMNLKKLLITSTVRHSDISTISGFERDSQEVGGWIKEHARKMLKGLAVKYPERERPTLRFGVFNVSERSQGF